MYSADGYKSDDKRQNNPGDQISIWQQLELSALSDVM